MKGPGNEDPLIELVSVAKRYGNATTPVLAGIDFRLYPGESVAIVGPSGSGKTTLLNLVGGLDHPSEGQVYLCGRGLSGLGEKELAGIRAREIGFVFQLHHLLPQCTALENVLIPTLAITGAGLKSPSTRRQSPAPAGESRQTDTTDDRARRLLARVGLSHRLTHFPGTLSGGERQRVAVARALINAPKLVLADEPTGSLDRAAAESMADLLLDLNREEGVALLVITHSMSLAGRMSRVIEIRDGSLLRATHPGGPPASSEALG